MSILFRIVFTALLAATLGLIGPGLATGAVAADGINIPSEADDDAIEQESSANCFRRDYVDGTKDQICTGWGQAHKGSSVTQPTSYWNRNIRSNKTVSLRFNFKLTDTAADGKCAWVRVLKSGNYSYDYYVDSACGKGESGVVNFELRDLPDVAPGRFRLAVCAGQGDCRVIFVRRFIE